MLLVLNRSLLYSDFEQPNCITNYMLTYVVLYFLPMSYALLLATKYKMLI